MAPQLAGLGQRHDRRKDLRGRGEEKRVGDEPTVDYPWLAEPDRDALQTFMRHVYENPQVARAKGHAAREHILANFTWERSVVEIETRIRALRDRLWLRIQAAGGVRLNGGIEHRLPGNLNVSFAGVDGDALLTSIPEIAVSAGSACTSGSDSSYVLEALGTPPEFLNCTVRFGIGCGNTQDEIDYVAGRVCAAVAELRALSPVL